MGKFVKGRYIFLYEQKQYSCGTTTYLSMFHFAVAADVAFIVVRLGFIP